MGRSVPPYTRVYEAELSRILKVAKLLGKGYIKYGEEMVELARRFRGLLSREPHPDLEIDIIYLLLIELFRRLDECERLDPRNLSRYSKE